MSTTLNKNSFRPLFGEWWPKIEPFFLAGGFDPIYKELKQKSARGIKIFPSSENVFRAFKECPLQDLKLIVCGISPYHSQKDNIIIADGLCMSCSNTNYLQPTLDQWYLACERELNSGLCLPCTKNPDLTFLARQGILLLNAGLTTEAMKPCSHNHLWRPFMEYLFTNVLDVYGIPIVLMGKEAHVLEKYINPFNTIFKVSHPASVSYLNNGTEWDSEGIFKKINQILKSKNNETIKWFDEDMEAPF